MKHLWLLPLLLPAAPLSADIIPEPSAASPRIQTVRWQDGQIIQLTALPATCLTLLFAADETITGVTADQTVMTTNMAHERNALQIMPLREGSLGPLEVTTTRRRYAFSVRTGSDLMAAYLVRFEEGPSAPQAVPGFAQMPSPGLPPPLPATLQPAVGGQSWSYRMRGDWEVRPEQINDDGSRTYIAFAADSALPAVFVVGPTGEEQLVNGYMRGGRFVIDQVWPELVFRIDNKRATARRSATPDAPNG